MIKKIYRYLLSLLLMACLLTSLCIVAFAVVPGQIQIQTTDGVEIVSDIAVSGEVDDFKIEPNSYKIIAKDRSRSALGQTLWIAQERTVTFTNNYSGEIRLTYTIDGNGTLTCKSPCTKTNDTISMPGGSSFTIKVTSPGGGLSTTGGTQKSKTCIFSPSAIWYEPKASQLYFDTPDHGTFTVTDADGNDIALETSATSTQFALKATPTDGYKFYRWKFTDDAGVTYFGIKSESQTRNADKPGTLTCEFIPEDCGFYSVSGNEYAYLDEAITAAGSNKQIVVIDTGTVYGTTGQTKFTIPKGVTMVLPYATNQILVQGSDLGSWDGAMGTKFAHGNYAAKETYEYQPGTLAATNVELTIPDGTTIENKGIIAVGGTLYGNAAMSGAHSNLKVDGELLLSANTSVLSAIGYVYGDGTVKVTKNAGAKIFQPLSMLRSDSWFWSVGNIGAPLQNGRGMETYPADGYNAGNPSPRYTTQAIQCRLEMASGNTMYGYSDQENSDTHYRANVILVGDDADESLIALHDGATLVSTYDKTKTSSLYPNVGKQTLTIIGNATQGTISIDASVYGDFSLGEVPFPIPYNYDIILENGTFNLRYDLSLLPGAGLKVASDATLNIPKGVHLAVFTGSNDHSTYGVHSNNQAKSTTSYNKGTTKAPNYPVNSTLGDVSGGNYMANFVVDGMLNIASNAYFGGVVQTNGSGTIIMNGVTDDAANKDYVFTRQLGLTGKCNDMDGDIEYLSGATIYKFYPQYFDVATGELTRMESGQIYYGVNNTANTNGIETFSFDLYTTSADVGYKESYSEDSFATATGQWSTIPTVQALNGNGEFVKGYGTLQAAISDYPNITADKPYLQINLASPVVVHDSNRYVLSGNSDAELKSDVYLDLNGCNITGNITRDAKTTHTLYGFDSGTNSYTAGGSITGTIAAYSGTAPLDRGPNADKNYIAVNDGNVYTFPRASVSVTGIQFYKSDGNYYAIFRGNYKSALNASTVGFVFNGNAPTSIGASGNEFPFYYGRRIDSSLTSVSATATVNSIGITSLERSLSGILAEFDAYKGEET